MNRRKKKIINKAIELLEQKFPNLQFYNIVLDYHVAKEIIRREKSE